MKKILIMGLPGSGKTTLAANLTAALIFNKVIWFNADTIREQFNDWDFSDEGRLRQAYRMRNLADEEIKKGNTVICDFVAPTHQIREIFNADLIIWVDTIKEGRFENTNKIFEPPTNVDIRVIDYDTEKWIDEILKII